MYKAYEIIFGTPEDVVNTVRRLMVCGWEPLGPAMPDSSNLPLRGDNRVFQTMVIKTEKTT